VCASVHGVPQEFDCKNVVFAMGGVQSRSDALSRDLGHGVVLRSDFESKTWTTSELFTTTGQARLSKVLPRSPRIVVIGGSHSAITTAWLLLNRFNAQEFDTHPIEILHRRPPRLFYPTADAALAEGYRDFEAGDVCPVTRRLYRLGGLRLSARELVAQIMGLGARAVEKRAMLQQITALSEVELRSKLRAADVIVSAFGYRPRTVPVYDACLSNTERQRILLHCEQGTAAPMVDAQCRLLDATARPIAGMFGIGLASGFVPHGAMGGEPNFRGQTNGLWLYQNDVGMRILDALDRDAD
jgi:hypothetical protein